MKLPESLFVAINPFIRFLLRSPLHPFLSSSLMLITYTGRKSQRVFTTPVRYVRVDNAIRCFTSPEILWWRNLRGGAEVMLRVKGKDIKCLATVIENDPARVREAMQHYLTMYPQDAAYHEIKLKEDKSLVIADLERATLTSIVVEAKPLSDIWK